VQEAERTVGRTPAGRWGPREIDIDILLYDGLVVQEPDLQVPHTGLPERRFVLIPLRDIAEDVVHPVSGLTVTEMASACTDSTRVVRSAYHIRI
jgi:2-amino-4-hydroxy-6-hydroxymethyldihydropteridine diphosphokinase